jgi:hypothetical protein
MTTNQLAQFRHCSQRKSDLKIVTCTIKMGTPHISSPLDEVIGGVAAEYGFDSLSDGHNFEDSEDEFYNALTTTDEEYPFQGLAPPPTQRSYATYKLAEKDLHEWTAARGYGLRINRTNWVDKHAVVKEPKYRSFVCDRADARGKAYLAGRTRKTNKRSRAEGYRMEIVLKVYKGR